MIKDETLILHIDNQELYDDINNEFIYINDQTIALKHSLVSVSKWEAKWKTPFLSAEHDMTYEQTIDYIRCMTITQNVDENIYRCMNKYIPEIGEYIRDSMTATWFSDQNDTKNGFIKNHRKETITSELVYYWMSSYHIDPSWEKRHFNRLLTLIRVFAIKSQPNKKMNKKQSAEYQSALIDARRKELNTAK